MHRRALADATDIVTGVTPAELDRATPCAGWDLGTLLAHMIGQNAGFAQAVERGDAPLDAFAARRPDPVALRTAWQDSADRLAGALAAAPLERRVRLVELGADARLAVATLVGLQLLDTVVHTWDVASALDRTFRPDHEIVAEVLTQARLVPDSARTGEGAAFGAAFDRHSTDDWDRALGLLGRANPPGREPPR